MTRNDIESLSYPRWIILLAWLAPVCFAALLSLQDVDTLALAGESTLFVALLFKWLVVAYLWPLLIVPAWIIARHPTMQRRPILSVLCQVSLGPAAAYLHIEIFYLLLSQFAGMGAFALRHSRAYYMASRYITELVLYYGLIVCMHAVLWYQRSTVERYQRLRLENELLLSQLHMLNIQLQPHFLFNALNSISSLMRKDIDEADHLLIEVGAFLRKTLSVSSRSTIPFEEELGLAKTYYQLQNLRYDNRASLLLEVSSATLSVQVPPMILQPIIENAFVHSQCERLTIGLSCSLEGNAVSLRIENSGAPLRENMAEQSGERIGLQNVRGRLRCLYGDASSFSIRNRAGEGVCVEMTIPLGTKGDFHYA